MVTPPLLDVLKDLDHKSIEIFDEADLTNDEILRLTREELLELIPGGINFKRRKILFEKLQALLREGTTNACQDDIERNDDTHSPNDSYLSNLLMNPVEEVVVGQEKEKHSLKRKIQVPISSEKTIANDISDEQPATSTPIVKKSLQIESPSYILYHEPVTNPDKISEKEYNSIVRGQINCMLSSSYVSPFKRAPTFFEVKEMSKSMIIKYPGLNDEDMSYEKLYGRLKRRLQNVLKPKNPQGKVPSRSKNKSLRSKLDSASDLIDPHQIPNGETSCNTEAQIGVDLEIQGNHNFEKSGTTDQLVEDCAIGSRHIDTCTSNSQEDNSQENSEEVMERHFQKLQKEMEKKKPCEKTLHLYLNMEFKRRRRWIKSLPYGKRLKPIFQVYPCFENHLHIINEVGRICGFQGDIVKESIKSLRREIDSIIFYGLNMELQLPAPKPSFVDKVVYVLQHINKIFPSKKKGNEDDLIVVVKVDEDVWAKAKKDSIYILKDLKFVRIMLGRSVLCKLELSEIVEAFVALIGLCYLADMDYPRSSEISFTLLQFVLFRDSKTPGDLVTTVDEQWRDYNKYKCPEDKEHICSFESKLPS